MYGADVQNFETKPDKAYKWFIRSMYLAVVSLNVWYMTETIKQTEEGRAALDRLKIRTQSAVRVWHGRTFFNRHAAETVTEAEVIIKEAEHG